MSYISKTIQQLLQKPKGILAADESTESIKKRFAALDIPSTPETHRQYRQMLFTTPGIEQYISGVILFDETFHQATDDGILFPQYLSQKGIIPGIKVDLGTEPMTESPEEKQTKGLDGLSDRLNAYYAQGARFAKWRAVFSVTDTLPSNEACERNAKDMARYAALCQAHDIVPIVEPEVLMDGDHTIERCFEVTEQVLDAVFAALRKEGVDLAKMLLKPNMIMPGDAHEKKATREEVAEKTVACFEAHVPKDVPGIVFLSGGQSEEEACEHLKAIVEEGKRKNVPWTLTFSFGRALQHSALEMWDGDEKSVKKAQEVFLERAKVASESVRY